MPDAFLTATPWVSTADTVAAAPSNPTTSFACSAYLLAFSELSPASFALAVAVVAACLAVPALPLAAVALAA